ncbi:MerR family transcriptional regulator [Sphaerisporangium dianthi]|uniref:MerR family transcriptional regulator n=1 Tax=Sphaerisporangium dianthi TaxID=1436120 RepID=A0ABV9CLR5_9ACTN
MSGGGGTRLRPVDLARVAGISAQQVRNYADTGILPPAPRTPAGYRSFGEEHRAALHTYRALARGYGWDAARRVMQTLHAGDLAGALALVDAGHAALHRQRLSLRATARALEEVAGQRSEPASEASARSRRGLRVGEVAALLGVRTSALRLWESAGLLTPGREPGTRYRRYTPADVRDARMVHMLRQGRYPLPQIKDVIEGLRRTGSRDALREAVEQRAAELTERAAGMLEASSHLHHYLSAHPHASSARTVQGRARRVAEGAGEGDGEGLR